MMNVKISESIAVRENGEENIELTQVQQDVANLVYELRDTCGREFRITTTELNSWRELITLEIRGVRVLEMWEESRNIWSLCWYGSSRDEDLVYLYLILYPVLDREL